MGRSSRTIYVGNLPGDIRESEVEDLFYKVYFKILLDYVFRRHILHFSDLHIFFCDCCMLLEILLKYSLLICSYCPHWIFYDLDLAFLTF